MEIKLKNVSFSYKDKAILKGININIKKGKFVSILGKNGSGKSTLISLLSQKIKANKGEVLYLNKNIDTYSKKSLARKFAFLLQFNKFAEDILVEDYIYYGRTPFKNIFAPINKRDILVVDEVIKLIGLENFKKRKMSSLSGGEKQRVYLAMCLAQEPEVLIMDEPTNHLDLYFQFELLSLIKEINIKKNITVICILHDLNQAIKVSDEVILLKDKKVYKQGNIKECFTKENIKEVFNIDVNIHNNQKNIFIEYK